MRPLRITYLLESLTELWGGVKTACLQAESLHRRGHRVTVVARSGPPGWMTLTCPLRTVPDFTRASIPDSDLVLGTFITTVPYAVAARRGVPVHLCQGYEGDNPEYAAHRAWIEAEYHKRDATLLVISPHLQQLMRERFARPARLLPYAVDHQVFFPAPTPRAASGPLRVALVGPAAVPWKDVAMGAAAAALVWRAGLDLTLVRISPVPFDHTEPTVPCPAERHACVPPARMGDLLRSCDVLLGTSSGAEEGFFLPAVEAMASGVPCVLTDVPCFRGYDTPTDYALFAPPRTPAAMAEQLVTLATQPEVAARLRQRGLAVAARYSWDRHLDALGCALEGILGSSGRLPRRVPA